MLPAGNIKRIIELMSDKADMDFSHGKGETLSRLYYGIKGCLLYTSYTADYYSGNILVYFSSGF